MTINDGGPAFPVECCYNGDGKIVGLQTSAGGGWETGMTLRDYFAAKAAVGLVERWSPSSIHGADEIAKFAFALADAMLKAREPDTHISQETE